MSGHHVEVDGRMIFVRNRGNGAPVVLLHGFPQTGEAWTKVADKLSGRNRVIVPDLPGYGRSDAASSADAGDVARLLFRAIEAAGADKFALVGHDWGGSIALRMALQAPERVERLVVVNAPFRHLDLLRGAHMLLFNVPLLPEAALGILGRRLVPLMIKAASKKRDAFDDEAMRGYGEAFADFGRARSALAYYRTTTRALVRKQAGALVPFFGSARPLGTPRPIEVPTLIVWGMSDPIMPASLIPTIERDIPGAQVLRLPDVGHFVPEEAPDELAHGIDEFLMQPAR